LPPRLSKGVFSAAAEAMCVAMAVHESVDVSVNIGQSTIFDVARIAERSPRRRSSVTENYIRKRLTKKECFKT